MTQSMPFTKSAKVTVLALLACLAFQVMTPDGRFHVVGAAYADDDDGGSDDDDDAGGASGTDGFGDEVSAPPRSRTLTRAPGRRTPGPEVAVLQFASAEIVVTGLSDSDLAVLLGEGYAVNDRQALSIVSATVTRLAVPDGQDLAEARARVRLLPTGPTADFNHFYRPENADAVSGAAEDCRHENCAALRLVGWPGNRETRPECRVTTSVGLIDTGVNAEHEILEGARLSVIRLADESLGASKAVHGTAIASLLVGSPSSRVPGLIPEAEVIAVDVFSDVEGDERADAATLVRALDLLAARNVRVINMSLAGPANTVLQSVLDMLTADTGPNAVILSASGNGGPTAAPAWPAAHPGVIAVTAADTRTRIYRLAQRGPHLDLAAPGVNLLTATSIQGARAKSGTSFAVPFATAAAAMLVSQQPGISAAAVAGHLRASARDLGADGPDEVFGFGMLSLDGRCGLVSATTE
jgi:minor extracellular protease Epr